MDSHTQRPMLLIVSPTLATARRLAGTIGIGGASIAAATSTAAATLAARNGLDVLVLDADACGPDAGVSFAADLHRTFGTSTVIVGSTFDPAHLTASEPFGWQLLHRPCHDAQITTSVRHALRYREAHRARPTAALPTPGREGAGPRTPGSLDLREREREVVDLLLQHYRVPAIAERLSISPHTVRNHLKNIFRRCGVRSQQELLHRLHERHDGRRKMTHSGYRVHQGQADSVRGVELHATHAARTS
jgi:DNA-binding CsgD family transcriptional regulator